MYLLYFLSFRNYKAFHDSLSIMISSFFLLVTFDGTLTIDICNIELLICFNFVLFFYFFFLSQIWKNMERLLWQLRCTIIDVFLFLVNQNDIFILNSMFMILSFKCMLRFMILLRQNSLKKFGIFLIWVMLK